jgi:hypothetical protein
MIEPKPTQKQTTARSGPPSAGQVVPFRPAKTSSGPRALAPEASALTFTWEALERQLTDLAMTPTQRGLVKTLVSGTRKQAAFKPMEQVLREVLCIASVLMDETFHPDPGQPEAGGGKMT